MFPLQPFLTARGMMCIGMHEIGPGECGHSAGVINVRMRVTAHRSTSIILGYCSVSFGRVAHLSVRLAHTHPPNRAITLRTGMYLCLCSLFQ